MMVIPSEAVAVANARSYVFLRCHIRGVRKSLYWLRSGTSNAVFAERSWSQSRLLSSGLFVVPLMPPFLHPLQPWLPRSHSVLCQLLP